MTLAFSLVTDPPALVGISVFKLRGWIESLDGVEREILLRALELHRYNRTAAGSSLGLSLRQMRYRMARLNVGVGNEAAGDDGNA